MKRVSRSGFIDWIMRQPEDKEVEMSESVWYKGANLNSGFCGCLMVQWAKDNLQEVDSGCECSSNCIFSNERIRVSFDFGEGLNYNSVFCFLEDLGIKNNKFVYRELQDQIRNRQ